MADSLCTKEFICFYRDGHWEPVKELVRCENCAYWDVLGIGEYKRCRHSRDRGYSPADYFCGHGKTVDTDRKGA